MTAQSNIPRFEMSFAIFKNYPPGPSSEVRKTPVMKKQKKEVQLYYCKEKTLSLSLVPKEKLCSILPFFSREKAMESPWRITSDKSNF